MSAPTTILSLRVFLAAAFSACLLMQGLVLPVASGWVAEALPEVSYMRWPVLVWAVLLVLLGEIVLACTWVLLGAVSRDRIFTTSSLPWVNRIIGAFVAAGVAVLAGLVFLVVDGTVGPITVHLFVLMSAIGCFALAALVIVLRALLVQATVLRSDMDEVI